MLSPARLMMWRPRYEITNRIPQRYPFMGHTPATAQKMCWVPYFAEAWEWYGLLRVLYEKVGEEVMRSTLLARMLPVRMDGQRRSLRRDVETLDSLFGDEWREALEGLANLNILTYEFNRFGEVQIYILKQTFGRTR